MDGSPTGRNEATTKHTQHTGVGVSFLPRPDAEPSIAQLEAEFEALTGARRQLMAVLSWPTSAAGGLADKQCAQCDEDIDLLLTQLRAAKFSHPEDQARRDLLEVRLTLDQGLFPVELAPRLLGLMRSLEPSLVAAAA